MDAGIFISLTYQFFFKINLIRTKAKNKTANCPNSTPILNEIKLVTKFACPLVASSPAPSRRHWTPPQALARMQAATTDHDTRLLTGSIVVIQSLRSKPELNGTSAKVKGYITASDRYSVVPVGLESAIGIKRANLKQDTAARLPSAEEVDDESEYPLADALAVLDVLDSLDDYAPAVAVACLTRCVKALMDEEAGQAGNVRSMLGATTFAGNDGSLQPTEKDLKVAAPTKGKMSSILRHLSPSPSSVNLMDVGSPSDPQPSSSPSLASPSSSTTSP